jgi:Putative silver efflux pump
MEVGPSVFFSLLVIAVSFLPIFTLVDQEGRLFTPLAWSKNFAMAIAAVLAITLDPAMRMLFARMDPFRFGFAHGGESALSRLVRLPARLVEKVVNAVAVGTYHAEEKHPVSKVLFRLYDPVCRAVLRHPKKVVAVSLLVLVSTVPVYLSLGRSSCRRSTRGRSSTCRRRSPASRSPRPRSSSRPRTGSSRRSPRWSASSARRARGDLDRPGAPLDDGDDGHPEARGGVAAEGALVLPLGAGLALGGPPARLARPESRTRSSSARWTPR